MILYTYKQIIYLFIMNGLQRHKSHIFRNNLPIHLHKTALRFPLFHNFFFCKLFFSDFQVNPLPYRERK